MYERRFGEAAPARRSIDQLRGIEGARVREMYRLMAQRHGVSWEGRRYDPTAWDASDLPNRCLSAATAALYGLCEAAILAAGYAPAIGFLHSGKPQSFVYDIADLFKFETVVPEAFRVMAAVVSSSLLDGERIADPVAAVRRRCRDAFRRTNLLSQLIPAIDDVLAAGGLPVPVAPEEVQPVAIPNQEASGDVGHRG
jgi:CRISPR-associated protein Cas1